MQLCCEDYREFALWHRVQRLSWAGTSAVDTRFVTRSHAKVVARGDFGRLIEVLATEGFDVIGPTKLDEAIVYRPVVAVDDLPIGWTDNQDGGSYRLEQRDDAALFGFVVGPQSWKAFLFPPRSTLLTIESVDGELTFTAPEPANRRYAFLGIRSCELAAIAIQDRVFLESGSVDRTYASNRSGLFTVGVNCAVAGGTCFCVSMDTGPRCTSGYDLVLTEVLTADTHEFVFEAGSAAGEQVLEQVPGREATDADFQRVAAIVADTSATMGRDMDTTGVRELLYTSRDSPHWENVAERCLSCTNCTLVCPTCFCSTTEDTASLDGASGERSRRWDSCFALDFTGLHGHPVRESPAARYRQWLTHKLATWQDQFDSLGCVGCGRCITWCPVGIDITKEVAAIRTRSEVPA